MINCKTTNQNSSMMIHTPMSAFKSINHSLLGKRLAHQPKNHGQTWNWHNQRVTGESANKVSTSSQ